MDKLPVRKERIQSLGEEIANSVSHGIGFLAAVIISPILIFSAVQHGSSAGIVGASIFSFSMVMLYIISTLYHSLARNKAKRVFQILDHVIIFLLIAGTSLPNDKDNGVIYLSHQHSQAPDEWRHAGILPPLTPYGP